MRAFLVLPVLALCAVVVGSGFELRYHDRIYPHVYVGRVGLDLGGQTQDGTTAQLRPFSLVQRFRTIVLLAPPHAPIYVPAHVLGYGIDGPLTARRAYSVGRAGTPLERVMAQARALVQGAAVPAAQRVNQRALRDYLFRLAPALFRPARPHRPGRQLDVARAQQRIAHLLLGIGAFTVNLPFTAVAATSAPRHGHRVHDRTHLGLKHLVRAPAKRAGRRRQT